MATTGRQSHPSVAVRAEGEITVVAEPVRRVIVSRACVEPTVIRAKVTAWKSVRDRTPHGERNLVDRSDRVSLRRDVGARTAGATGLRVEGDRHQFSFSQRCAGRL